MTPWEIATKFGLEEYFTSEDFEQDVENNTLVISSGDDFLPPELLVILSLHQYCPKFENNMDSFKDLGVPNRLIQKLETFFKKMKQGIDPNNPITRQEGANKVFARALSSRSLDLKYQELYEAIKRKDMELVTSIMEEILKLQKESISNRRDEFDHKITIATNGLSKDEETRKHYQHFLDNVEGQKRVIDQLETAYEIYIEAIRILIEAKFFQILDQFKAFKSIFQLILNACDLAVSVVYIGLLNTGKSTLVNATVGRALSPNRIDAMTAVPIRYVHSSDVQVPIMFVPFAGKLNRVVKKIRAYCSTQDQASFIDHLGKTYLRELFNKIMKENFLIKSFYEGDNEVYEISFLIQDLFRLAAHNAFPSEIAECLPLDWAQGFEYFLTIVLNFPDLDATWTNLLNFSIIDTPGVNESGVERLNLKAVVQRIIDSSHYVVFTLQPKETGGIDFSNLRENVVAVMNKFSTPSMVLATQADLWMESKKDFEEVKKNISMDLGTEQNPFNINKIYAVSGLRRYIGLILLREIERTNQKPPVKSNDAYKDKLVYDFIINYALGEDEQDKQHYYEKLTKQELIDRCKKLIQNSYLEAPLEELTTSAVKNSVTLLSITSLKKVLCQTEELSDQLSCFIASGKSLTLQAENSIKTIENLSKGIFSEIKEIENFLLREVKKLNDDVTKDLKRIEGLSLAKLNLKDPVEKEFKSMAEAQDHLKTTYAAVKNEFKKEVETYLRTWERKSGETQKSVHDQMISKVISRLNAVTVQLDDLKDFKLNPPKIPPQGPQQMDELNFGVNWIKSKERETSFFSKVGMWWRGQPIQKTQTFYVLRTSTARDEITKQIANDVEAYRAVITELLNNHNMDFLYTWSRSIIVKIEFLTVTQNKKIENATMVPKLELLEKKVLSFQEETQKDVLQLESALKKNVNN